MAAAVYFFIADRARQLKNRAGETIAVTSTHQAAP
jgi:hypothetical protein